MGCTYKSPQVTRPGQSIFLATPAKERIKPGYAFALAMTVSELTRRGVPFQLSIMEDNCHVDDGRNELCRIFLYETQCTDLVFIDADIRWQPNMLMQLISHDSYNIVAGAYPFKSYPIKFPVGKLLQNEGEENAKKGLLSVSYAPTGFMRIPRSVFDKLTPHQTKRGRKNPTHRFFERRYTASTYDGGDVAFCRKWISENGLVLIDSKLKLEHIGEWRWTGCFLDYLASDEKKELHTTKSKDPVPKHEPDKDVKVSLADVIQSLEDDSSSSEDFIALADAWGNKPWAATSSYTELVWNIVMDLPDNSTVLECGSGMTTLVLGIAAKHKNLNIITLEHDQTWYERTKKWLDIYDIKVNLIKTEIDDKTKWYKIGEGDPGWTIDLLVLDGPPRWLGADRLHPLKQPWAKGSRAIIDDVNNNVMNKLNQIDGKWEPFNLDGRGGCVGRMK
jgi:hypothetical protein